MGRDGGKYGVKLVRGPVVELEPHVDTCTVDELPELAQRSRAAGRLVAADLFCGAGGMSLGLADGGVDVVVGVDTDQEALATHAAWLPGLHLDWDLGEPERVESLAEILESIEIDIIAGGPPCQPFSKAGRSMIRDLVRKGRRPSEDQRRDLWQSFLAIVERVQPRAVLMENVPDMALDREMLILRTMVDELERLGYSVEAQVVETSKYGVPQHRQRLILVAIEDGRQFRWPHEVWDDDDAPQLSTLGQAIGDLPDVEPGWRPDPDGPDWADYATASELTSFQARAREGVTGPDRKRIYDHITRPVRDDDLEAFQLLTSDMRYSELPAHLKRYRDDIFDDKYKRLDENGLSRTITAHIAKDGYWYIHPRHHRTLTIREAARIQTFRDAIRFSGPPTAAFRQIGNAVPPMLAEWLGRGIRSALDSSEQAAISTAETSELLADWFEDRGALSVPWLQARTRWVVVQAEILLHRAHADQIRLLWPLLETLPTPADTLEHEKVLAGIGHNMAREERVATLLELARHFAEHPEHLESRPGLREAGTPEAVADVALVVHPSSAEDPVVATSPILRVAARYTGSDVHARNRRSDGRIAVARMIGLDPPEVDGRPIGRLAHLALFELSASLCRPDRTDCDACPLSARCATTSAGAAEGALVGAG